MEASGSGSPSAAAGTIGPGRLREQRQTATCPSASLGASRRQLPGMKYPHSRRSPGSVRHNSCIHQNEWADCAFCGFSRRFARFFRLRKEGIRTDCPRRGVRSFDCAPFERARGSSFGLAQGKQGKRGEDAGQYEESRAYPQGGQGWGTPLHNPERCCGILPNWFRHTAKSFEVLGPGSQPAVCAERKTLRTMRWSR